MHAKILCSLTCDPCQILNERNVPLALLQVSLEPYRVFFQVYVPWIAEICSRQVQFLETFFFLPTLTIGQTHGGALLNSLYTLRLDSGDALHHITGR